MKTAFADVPFLWVKPELGYEWQMQGRARWLVPNMPGGRWAYTPQRNLFRTFARIAIADERTMPTAILSFANEYGDITVQPQESTEELPGDDQVLKGRTRRVTRKRATEKETWCRTIQHMRRAVDLWDIINTPDRHGELRRIITRGAGAITYRKQHHPLERRGGNETYEGIASGKDVKGYPGRDLVGPARRALRGEIQLALSDAETPSYATPVLTPELRLAVYPVNLLADMWWTFARVVSGEIEERQCIVCDGYFYVGSGSGLRRADKVTCGAACRQRKKRSVSL